MISIWTLVRATFVMPLVLLSLSFAHADTPLSQAQAEAVPDAEYDFARLLYDTNPVEACTRELEAKMSRELGPDFLPAGYESLECRCYSAELNLRAERLAPTNPALQNVIVHFASNFELISIMNDKTRHPDGADAFVAFVKQAGKTELGFDMADLERAGQVLEDMNSAELDLITEQAKQLPSCVSHLEMVTARFPEFKLAGGTSNLESLLARQRIKYDQGIDLARVDDLLTTDNFGHACLTVHSSILYATPSVSDMIAMMKVTSDLCKAIRQHIDTQLGETSEADRPVTDRVTLVALYARVNKSTSQSHDLTYYVAEQLGASSFDQARVTAVFDAVASFNPRTSTRMSCPAAAFDWSQQIEI